MRKKTDWHAYTIDKKVYTALAILIPILILSYFGCICWENSVNSSYLEAIKQGEVIKTPAVLNFITFLESLITIVFSVFLSSVLTAFIISKREKNDIYRDAFVDMIDKTIMEITIPEDSESRILANLKKTIGVGHIPANMTETVIRKALLPQQCYYYQNCEIDIKCHVEDGYLVKQIMKNMFVRSYEPTCVIKKGAFNFASQCGQKGVKDALVISDIKVLCDGKSAEPAYKIGTQNIKDNLSVKQGYIKKHIAYCDEDFSLYGDKTTKVTVSYITRVPLSDLTYVFRVPCSCKHLHLQCHLSGMDNYSIRGYAFGFMDDARNTVSGKEKTECEFALEDWAFYGDGACFIITKDNE